MKQDVVRFFEACAGDAALLERFDERNLAELLFHARVLGFSFTREELAAVVGGMEWHVITEQLGEEMTGNSSLWPRMWGVRHLRYVIEQLFVGFPREQLERLVG